VTFTSRRETCSPVHINDLKITQENHVKYLGLHLDPHLTWHTHISSKRKQLGFSLTKMYWLLGPKSKLSINNKLLIWTYGIQLWSSTSNSNVEILERLQSKVLRLIVEASGTCQIPLTVMTFKYQQSKKKSAYSAPITMFASVYTPINSSPHSPSCQFKGACVDTDHTTCLSDSSNLY
jgi:hypothetical protein